MTTQPDLTTTLGEESPTIEFPAGLVGFDEWKRFVLITHPSGGPLRLLQSLDDRRVSFLVASPYHVVPDYRLSLAEADTLALRLADPAAADVYCILSVQEEPLTVTANLLGPLVVNWQAGLGQQVILADSGYGTRYPVVDAPIRPSPAGEGGEEKEGEPC
jgi:flagellar assembly factor FliW